jgi:hypothetical protein
MKVEKNNAIVTRLLEQCTACINLPRSNGWGGCLCARTMAVERGRARLSCTIGGGATVIGVKRERKKELCRPGRDDDRRGKSRESQWAAVCARGGLKWSAVVQPFYVANIYESLYYIRATRGAGWVEVAIEKKGERGCYSLLPLQRAVALSCFPAAATTGDVAFRLPPPPPEYISLLRVQHTLRCRVYTALLQSHHHRLAHRYINLMVLDLFICVYIRV